ncbi:extracellular catalytic domain type 1 short-chain-length polyhydroxyalkanoate depolymerase [Nostoc sp.]|uniref:extracellular catalytic domain type 1 short-chain-length polyhydroxyalkanoate depolymerase n=1 Tax=Nostoc sp. TaxID=1180 RepID=UPI002FF4CE39
MNIHLSFQLLKRVFIFFTLIGLVTACESIQAQQITARQSKVIFGASDGELTEQGSVRTYYIYTPKSYSSSRPMPLVLVFHGDDGSGRSISNVSGFNELAEQKGFIVVYPDGIDHTWSLRKKGKRKIDDISFVKNLINHLQQVRNIDKRRIYATGFSKGGILTQALTCQLSDQIAAFASVAGSLPMRLEQTCQPLLPVSMLMINGTNDQSVHYQGDEKTQKGALVSIPKVVNFWRDHNQCPTYAANDVAFALDNARSSDKVKTYSYSGCSAGSEVLGLAVVNGGHLWYGGTSNDKNINKFNKNLGLDSTQMIWNFFERHTLPPVPSKSIS